MAKSFEDEFNELAGAPAEDTAAEDASQAPMAAADAEPPEPAPQDTADAAAEPVSAEPAADATPEPAAEPPKPPRLEEVIELLPAEARDRYKALIETTAKDLHRYKSEMGRAAAMQRLYEQAKAREASVAARMAELEAKVATAQTPAQQAKAKADVEEEQDQLAVDYPELSEALNMRFERMLKKLSPPATAPAATEPTERARSEPPPLPNDAEVTALAREYQALADAHSDWQEAVNSPEFGVWFQRQPPGVQALLGSPNAKDAIWMLDQFKGNRAQAQARAQADRKVENRKRLEQNVGVKGSPPRLTEAPNEFEAAFNYFANQS